VHSHHAAVSGQKTGGLWKQGSLLFFDSRSLAKFKRLFLGLELAQFMFVRNYDNAAKIDPMLDGKLS
jgi:hypothetical protein